MKTPNQKPSKSKKHASSASSLRLALESRLLFDGAVVAIADAVMDQDQKPSPDSQPDPTLDNSADIAHVPPAFGNFFELENMAEQPSAIAQAASAGASAGIRGGATLLIVDPRAPGLDLILQNPAKDCDIRVLDQNRDSYEQISEILKGRGNTEDLHIQAADLDGKQVLGGSQISQRISQSDSLSLMDWGDNLSHQANITFHCERLPTGQPWLNHIRALTGGLVNWSRDTVADSEAVLRQAQYERDQPNTVRPGRSRRACRRTPRSVR